MGRGFAIDQLLAFDNGVRDRFGVIGREGILKTQLKWDWLIGETVRLIPELERDYTTIDTPAGFLEQINLGNFIDTLPQTYQDRIDAYFPMPEALYRTLKSFQQDALQYDPVGVNKILHESISFLSREVLVTIEALKHLFLQVIDRKEIIEKSVKWRRENPCHKHASSISGLLEDWEKELEQGDKGYGFEMLVRHLAWHVLMSRVWLIGRVGDGADVAQFEHNILLRLLHSYLMQMQDGSNLSGARLFARLERLGVSTSIKPKKRWLERPNLYKGGSGRELLDEDLAEFLVTGFVANKVRRPLIVITCDWKKQRERLKAIIRGVKYVNGILEGMHARKELAITVPAQIPIVPGVMVLVDKDRKKPSEAIDVQKLIYEVESENETASSEVAVIEQ